MTTGIWLLGDQLGLEHPALQGDKSPVLMIESLDYARQRPYRCFTLMGNWDFK
ncbi:cryptochrome/photolyase family protein [Spirulina sp. CS-785/01]|uniref:cryptochrome/photolyase family protein n=1 Tax=Spirulina sp. CS-785/01 TaxID=3021716 RepID=UPI00232AE8DB|nr:cryptochrome/photolyase family protein [Spirulina sp. CS-785/01]MDB9312741.1 cryptochrome/photolyase family protein [Spirulina sp. CS-785/01]